MLISINILKCFNIVHTILKHFNILKIYRPQMKNQIRWSRELTERLIKLRHEPETSEKFIASRNNPRKLQGLWEEISKNMNVDGVTTNEVKLKYNNLLCAFRTHSTESKRSGSGKIMWIYWDIFNRTFPDKLNTVPDNIIEVGRFGIDSVVEECGNFYISENNSYSASDLCEENDLKCKDAGKPKKVNRSFNKLKYDVYESLLSKLKAEESNIASNIIYARENDVNEKFKQLNEKLDFIISALKKE